MGPIIFLRLSEKSTGMYDGIFSSRAIAHGEQNVVFGQTGHFISYASAVEATANKYNLSPRQTFNGAYEVLGKSLILIDT